MPMDSKNGAIVALGIPADSKKGTIVAPGIQGFQKGKKRDPEGPHEGFPRDPWGFQNGSNGTLRPLSRFP